MRDFEVKTALCEGHYKAMQEVLEANGMTQAGYVRHLILRDIYQSQDLVSQMSAIRERNGSGPKLVGSVPITGQKSSES